MALAVMVITALGSGMAVPEAGVCTYYNPGVMERVAEYRGLEGMEGIVGYAAVLHCEQIGELVTINGQGPFRVVDCAEKKHKANLAARGIVAEVDYETAMRWEMAGPVTCEVAKAVD